MDHKISFKASLHSTTVEAWMESKLINPLRFDTPVASNSGCKAGRLKISL